MKETGETVVLDEVGRVVKTVGELKVGQAFVYEGCYYLAALREYHNNDVDCFMRGVQLGATENHVVLPSEEQVVLIDVVLAVKSP